MTLHLHIKKDNSFLKLFNRVNSFSLLLALLFARLVIIRYISYSFICRGVVDLKYPLEVGKQIPGEYMLANNLCSFGDISILGIGVLFIFAIFGVSQFINYKKERLTVGNFIIMLILFCVVAGLLVCAIIGENSLMFNGL